MLDNGMYISAVWAGGQPCHDLLIIKPNGVVFRGDLSDKAKIGGCIYNPTNSADCPKVKSHDLTGEEYFLDGTKYEGRFDYLSKLR